MKLEWDLNTKGVAIMQHDSFNEENVSSCLA